MENHDVRKLARMAHVKFNTSRTDRWQTDSRRCHVNWVILDSDWEAEFCRVAESHPRVRGFIDRYDCRHPDLTTTLSAMPKGLSPLNWLDDLFDNGGVL
jgi:hypothetical protein